MKINSILGNMAGLVVDVLDLLRLNNHSAGQESLQRFKLEKYQGNIREFHRIK